MSGGCEWRWPFVVKNQVDRTVETNNSQLEPNTQLVPPVPWNVESGDNKAIEFSCNVAGGGGGIEFELTCGCTREKVFFYVLGDKCGLTNAGFAESKKQLKDKA